jgi:hypothetical protein
MARYRGKIEKSNEVANFRTSRISESTRMSAFGTKRTFGDRRSMSAFGGKADIAISARHVRS